MKSRWAVYLTERFPVVANLLIAVGIARSAFLLTGRPVMAIPMLISVFGGMVFLAQIRFMDEFKDYDKDCVAHPTRPLPRGLFSLAEFGRFIWIFNLFMGVIALSAGFVLGIRAGVWLAAGALYLHLMFKEFYLKEWLSNRPMLYAITHQVIIFPMVAFVFECFAPGATGSKEFWGLGILLLSAFFGFEVGRKLNPDAHPVLNTYLKRYGRERTAALILVLLAIGVKAAESLGAGSSLRLVFVLVAASLSLLWGAPGRFKWIEGLVTLFLLLAIWAVPISRVWG